MHLSPEEETKLLQLWQKILEIIDVKLKQPPLNLDATPDSATPDSNVSQARPATENKGFFGRFRGTANEASTDSNTLTPGPIDHFPAMTPSQLRQACWYMYKHDHPDDLLLRFLRHQKWNVPNAFDMLINTLKWRTQERVDDDIMFHGEEGALSTIRTSPDKHARDLAEGFMKQLRRGESYIHGVDKQGRPICIIRARLHHSGDQSVKSMERGIIWTFETTRLLMKSPATSSVSPELSPHRLLTSLHPFEFIPKTPTGFPGSNEKNRHQLLFFDMTSFGISNMDYTPLKFMISLFEGYYPEAFSDVIVHKAPWLFQGFWRIIKGWMSAEAVEHVHFTNTVEDLETLIPRGNILKEYGGEDEWVFRYEEVREGENEALGRTEAREELLRERGEMGEKVEGLTRKWIRASRERQDVTEIKREREVHISAMQEGYWKLDPMIRARSFYDRWGVIHGGNENSTASSTHHQNGVAQKTMEGVTQVTV